MQYRVMWLDLTDRPSLINNSPNVLLLILINSAIGLLSCINDLYTITGAHGDVTMVCKLA